MPRPRTRGSLGEARVASGRRACTGSLSQGRGWGVSGLRSEALTNLLGATLQAGPLGCSGRQSSRLSQGRQQVLFPG